MSGVDLNYPDQMVAIFAAGMIATAWYARQRGRGGVHLDMSQRELTSFLCGEAFATSAAYGERTGNARAPYAIQDCLRTADGGWIAISVLPGDLPRLARLEGIEGPDRTALGRWIAARDAATALSALKAAGLCVASVVGAEEVLDAWRASPSFALAHTPDGSLAKGFPFQLDREPLGIARVAPVLGADTRAILADIAGFSPDQIADLVDRGIVEVAAAQKE